MITKKFKQCAAPGCTRPVFSHGYCVLNSHQQLRVDRDWIRKQEKQKEKPVKVYVIPKATKQRAAENREYLRKRELFLARPENHFCRKYPHLRATTVHHPAGRVGKLLLDDSIWIALSLAGHQWVEENPDLAKEEGLSFDRLSYKS